MKNTVKELLNQAVETLKKSSFLPADIHPEIKIERTRSKEHGDFASNIALLLAKPCKQNPKKVAEELLKAIPADPAIDHIEIAGPGFLNFFMHEADRTEIIHEILKQGDNFGRSKIGQNQKILLEFVSANPTGPLHVGHGRSAAYGASLGNLLSAAGYNVTREYYVNDAGRQMNILAVSLWLRYLTLMHESIVFPANAYQGDYILPIAAEMTKQFDRTYVHPWQEISDGLPPDEQQGGDKEHYIDALIHKAKALLGEDGFKIFHQHALDSVLHDIKEDLAEFRVLYESWFSEQSLIENGAIQKGIQALKDAGHTFEQGGALWFRATAFGDEKDRVLIRANGQTTYFASDVAYHWNKYERGFDRVIDIFGADHHGYISRIKAAVNALGHDETALNILLVQFAILYRSGERVQMSTRSGSFVTLRELREEVGCDAARFFYVMRKPEQHLDFDLDLAKSQSSDNPVYYIQYAHARICSVFRQLEARGLQLPTLHPTTLPSPARGRRAGDEGVSKKTFSPEGRREHALGELTEPHETALILLLTRYPETIESAARAHEPHQIAYYLRELANGLHTYYNAVTLLTEQESLRNARLSLLAAVRQVLSHGMQILGVSAPEMM